MKYIHDPKVDALVEPPVHAMFGLSHCAYFVVPRLALQSMPLEWQRKFVALIEEAEMTGIETPEYTILRRDEQGRYIDDPWANYRHGNAGTLCEALK